MADPLRRARTVGLTTLSHLFALALCLSAPAASADGGFGATTPGGTGRPVVRVTTLDDSGPGSLRDALAGGNRTVVFDVAGEIVLRSEVSVRGAFVTLDGFSAPPPGITLRNFGLDIRGARGAHDVVVRGLRVRNAWDDGIRVAYGAYNVVIDHVSVHGSADGNLDITEGAHDVTVSWSILAQPKDCGHTASDACRATPQDVGYATGKNMLVCYNASRVTVHHTIFTGGAERNPEVCMASPTSGTVVLADDTTLDMRNNLVWNYRVEGTTVSAGPRANIVANFYSAPAASFFKQTERAVVVRTSTSPAWAYAAGNVSGDQPGFDINRQGTEAAPFPAPVVDTETACAAAHQALASAGVRPLDDLDRVYLSRIALASCPRPPLTLVFTRPGDGATVSGTVDVSLSASGGTGYAYSVAAAGATIYAGTAPTFAWDTTRVPNGPLALTASVTDADGRTAGATTALAVSNEMAPLTVAIAQPNGGGTVSGTVTVSLSARGGTGYTYTVAAGGATIYTGTAPTFAWDTTGVLNGPLTLTASVRDAAGRAASATTTFTVANTRPNLTAVFLSPSEAHSVTGTTTVQMAVNAPTTFPNTFYLLVDGKGLVKLQVNSTAASYAWNTRGLARGYHQLYLSFWDATGRWATASAWIKVR